MRDTRLGYTERNPSILLVTPSPSKCTFSFKEVLSLEAKVHAG